MVSRSDLNSWSSSEPLSTFRPAETRTSNRSEMIQDPQVDPESDPEDDPAKLLNVWLGELDNLKKVKQFLFIVNNQVFLLLR